MSSGSLVHAHARDPGLADRAVVAQRHLHEQHFLEALAMAQPELEGRRGCEVYDEQVGFHAGREAADPVFEVLRARAAARREIERQWGIEAIAELRRGLVGLVQCL